MKIYTKTGDSGETGLLGGQRVWKNSARLDVCGTYDELNALLGLVRAEPDLPQELNVLLERFQNELFCAGSEIVAAPPASPPCPPLNEEHVRRIEESIDRYEALLPSLEHFILPGGCRTASLFHLARTICRRAERALVALCREEPGAINRHQLIYLNRLADLLFVLARWMNFKAGISDVPWKNSKTPEK